MRTLLLNCVITLYLTFISHSVFAQEIEARIGDEQASYASVEFTKDGQYMVWYEGENGNFRGQMWHCKIDTVTAQPTPPDCRGFKAFPSTAFGRANVGYDAKGPFYIGGNLAGEVIMVRPTGAETGTVTKLPIPANRRRKGYYPTQSLIDNKAYLVWGTREAESSSLKYVDLENPSQIYTIETQYKKAGVRMTAMDVGFFRVVNGAPLVTFGAVDDRGNIQIKMKDLRKPQEPARFVTREPHTHIDPYGFVDPTGNLYIVSGIDVKALMYVYKYSRDTGYFEKIGQITPPANSNLANPIMATSFEPIFKNGNIYGAYQINDGGQGMRGYINVAFQQPGEIWLVNLDNLSAPQIKLSGRETLIRAEPEPLMLNNKIWMFYNAANKGETIMNATWQLRRSLVPLK